jgi:hypothetical protein
LTDPLQTEITVKHEGKTYVFRIPSQRDNAKIGALTASMMLQDLPAGATTGLDNLDLYTYGLYRSMAIFHVLYVSGDNDWVLTASAEDGSPRIDPSRWRDDVPSTEVCAEFLAELLRFRSPPAE